MQNVQELLEGFFPNQLINAETRLKPNNITHKVRLDRNESAFELDETIKELILQSLATEQWRCYPPPYYNFIETLIAKYCGADSGEIVPAAGSANIITAALNYFAIKSNQIVIARPSFSLYEYHCKTYGIPYDVWMLNSDFEYDINLMPPLSDHSVVLFASPNNPVGNLITGDMLEELLKNNPKTLFIVDEVYQEFSGTSLILLQKKYANIILIRSFSKTFSVAGLRVGYMIGHISIATQIRKLIIPFSLNHLSRLFTEKVLSNQSIVRKIIHNVETIISEREFLKAKLNEVNKKEAFVIAPSNANFITLLFKNSELHKAAIMQLGRKDIQVLDLSGSPMLANSIRITIGTTEQNLLVLKGIVEAIG